MTGALFVRSPSPGAVLRYLERLARRGEIEAGEVLLSDASGASLWRALLAENLPPLALELALAFPPDVILLEAMMSDPQRWRCTTVGADGEHASEMLTGRRLWYQRHSPLTQWAHQRGLPLERVIHPPRIVSYETVETLDQRSLLVEDTPRLYRFSLPGTPGS